MKESVVGDEVEEVKGARLAVSQRSLLLSTLAFIVSDMRLLPQKDDKRKMTGSVLFLKEYSSCYVKNRL